MDKEEASTDEESDDDDTIHRTHEPPVPVPAGRRDMTLVFTTSISKGIHPPRFNRKYEHGFASFARFHGAKAEYMPAYVVPRMSKEKPAVVIIQAGGNDLPDNKTRVQIQRQIRLKQYWSVFIDWSTGTYTLQSKISTFWNDNILHTNLDVT